MKSLRVFIDLYIFDLYFLSACAAFTFGFDCMGRCGHCRQDKKCNLMTGHCSSGCKPGWTGERCDRGKSWLFFRNFIWLLSFSIRASLMSLFGNERDPRLAYTISGLTFLMSVMLKSVLSMKTTISDNNKSIYNKIKHFK